MITLKGIFQEYFPVPSEWLERIGLKAKKISMEEVPDEENTQRVRRIELEKEQNRLRRQVAQEKKEQQQQQQLAEEEKRIKEEKRKKIEQDNKKRQREYIRVRYHTPGAVQYKGYNGPIEGLTYRQQYYLAHKDEIKAKRQMMSDEEKEKQKQCREKSVKKHAEKRKAYQREYMRKKRANKDAETDRA